MTVRVGELSHGGGGLPDSRERAELRCARCGYWLLHADQDGFCPECGLGVRASVLFATDPRCIRQRRRVGVAGLLLCLSYVLLASWMWVAFERTRRWQMDSQEESIFQALSFVFSLPAYGALGAALWLCGLPGLECVLGRRERAGRFLARAVLVGLIVALTVWVAGTVIYWGRMWRMPSLFGVPMLITQLVSPLIVSLWLRNVMRFYPMQRVRGWLTAGVTVYAASVAVYGVVIFGLWRLLTLNYRVGLMILQFLLAGHVLLFLTVLASAWVVFRRSTGKWVGRGALQGKEA